MKSRDWDKFGTYFSPAKKTKFQTKLDFWKVKASGGGQMLKTDCGLTLGSEETIKLAENGFMKI